MSGLRILVADDDPLVCETIESFLGRIGDIAFCLKAGDGLSALRLLSSGEIDAAFVDVDLPGLDGASLLKALPAPLPVVIVSASDSFAVASYEHGVADYLLKPLEFPRFVRAMGRLREHLAENAARRSPAPAEGDSNAIFVKDGLRIVRIDFADLLYVEAEANYVKFVMTRSTVMSLMSMKRAEELLPPAFIRIHRSYMVNRARISRIENGIVLVETHRLPLGQHYRDETLRRLGIGS